MFPDVYAVKYMKTKCTRQSNRWRAVKKEKANFATLANVVEYELD